MPLTLSTDLTGKQETSSAGVLQKSYNKPSNRIPSHEKQKNFNGISRPIDLPKLTDDTSTSVLEEFLQPLIRGIPIIKNALQNEAIRGLSSRKNVANFQYLQEGGTSAVPSVHLLPLNNFPHKVKKCLNGLSLAHKESESILYELSDSVAEWLIDAPNEYHVVFAVYLQTMPSTSSRILMASLNDAEFLTDNMNLLRTASLFLKSDDKRLAQTAAAFLTICGGTIGKSILQEMLSIQEIPHSKLVQGINKLLV